MVVESGWGLGGHRLGARYGRALRVVCLLEISHVDLSPVPSSTLPRTLPPRSPSTQSPSPGLGVGPSYLLLRPFRICDRDDGIEFRRSGRPTAGTSLPPVRGTR